MIGGSNNFKFCLVPKAANDYYIPYPPAAEPSTEFVRDDLDCLVFDWTSGRCTSCNPGYVLNSLNGTCKSSCGLTGCKTSEGYAYCTECLQGYDRVDGICIRQTYADGDTIARCVTVTNGECTACDSQFYLDLKDSLGNPSTGKNKCIKIDKVPDNECASWVAGKCTAC
jgi:hypothetical protein